MDKETISISSRCFLQILKEESNCHVVMGIVLVNLYIIVLRMLLTICFYNDVQLNPCKFSSVNAETPRQVLRHRKWGHTLHST